MPLSPDDAVFQAEAAVRRQLDEIDKILARVAEAKGVMARARDEVAAEAEESRKDREQEEAQARTGALGQSRRELQRRIDRDETTWAEVMSGRDEHVSAQDYRDEVGRGVVLLLEKEMEDEPGLADALDQMSRHTDPGSPRVHVPDWPPPAPVPSDGRRPVTGPPDPVTPSHSPGTW